MNDKYLSFSFFCFCFKFLTKSNDVLKYFIQHFYKTLTAAFTLLHFYCDQNGLAFFGKAGVGTCFGGLLFSCCIIISIAFSNCGSCPAITSAGHCSTSTSGGVPTFSMPKPFSS